MSVRERKWQTKDGTERRVWLVAYRDKDRKQRYEGFELKRDAVARDAEIKGQIRKGTHVVRSTSRTIAEAGKEWLAQAEMDGLEAATLAQYRQHLEFHIVPLIGGVKLADMTPKDVEAFRNRLAKGEGGRARTPAMVKRVTISAGAIFAHAGGHNPVAEYMRATKSRRRRVEKRHEKQIEAGVDFPTEDEIEKLLTEDRPRYRPLIYVAIYGGLRASELRGLRWGDVDLGEGEITVRQRADRYQKIGSPKGADSRRTVPLPSSAVLSLKEWKLASKFNSPDSLVFPNGEGAVENLPNIHRRGLGILQVRVGITDLAPIRAAHPKMTETDIRELAAVHPKYGLKAFRHAAGTRFLKVGFNVKETQIMMGHSSAQITLDVYGHLIPDQKGNAEKLARLEGRLVG
jgi:integrase